MKCGSDARHISLPTDLRAALVRSGVELRPRLVEAVDVARGNRLRDAVLPTILPEHWRSEYYGLLEADKQMAERISRLADFGYRQCEVLAPPLLSGANAEKAFQCGAMSNVIVGVVDYLVDERQVSLDALPATRPDALQHLLKNALSDESAFSGWFVDGAGNDAAGRVVSALLLALLDHLHSLALNSRNLRAFARLARTMQQLQKVYVESSSPKFNCLGAAWSRWECAKEKAVLPSVVAAQISRIALPPGAPVNLADDDLRASLLGEVLWLIDDLVDVEVDAMRGAANAIIMGACGSNINPDRIPTAGELARSIVGAMERVATLLAQIGPAVGESDSKWRRVPPRRGPAAIRSFAEDAIHDWTYVESG